jgi:hypothetical protein
MASGVFPPSALEITDGRATKDAVHITPNPGATSSAISHFGHGVLTFD